MGYKKIKSATEEIPVAEYIADTDTDLDHIPKIWPGSTVYVISSKKLYVLNTALEWVDVSGSSGGGDGGTKTIAGFLNTPIPKRVADYTDNETLISNIRDKLAQLESEGVRIYQLDLVGTSLEYAQTNAQDINMSFQTGDALWFTGGTGLQSQPDIVSMLVAANIPMWKMEYEGTFTPMLLETIGRYSLTGAIFFSAVPEMAIPLNGLTINTFPSVAIGFGD